MLILGLQVLEQQMLKLLGLTPLRYYFQVHCYLFILFSYLFFLSYIILMDHILFIFSSDLVVTNLIVKYLITTKLMAKN